MFTRILIATDGSDHAVRAAEVAADIAEKFGARVSLLSVYMPPIAADANIPGLEISQSLIDEIHEAVTKRTGRALEDRNILFDTLYEVGHPADVIVQVAEDGKYDLIIVGSRGLGDFKRFLLGSVSDRVAHHSHCPVLIVKPEEHK